MNETTVELCEACRLIPVSQLGVDLEPPLGGWMAFLQKEGIDVQTDDCGRPSIARSVFGALVRERASERLALRAVEQTRSGQKTYTGVPAVEGLSPFESLVAADGGVVTPAQEFGHGWEKPRFFKDAIDAGQRDLAQHAPKPPQRHGSPTR